MSTKSKTTELRSGRGIEAKAPLVRRDGALYAPVRDLVLALGSHIKKIDHSNVTISAPIQSTTLLVWTDNPALPSYGATTIVRSTKYYTAFQYDTVDEAQSALEQLKVRSDVQFAEFNGWTYVDPEETDITQESDPSLRASYTDWASWNNSVKPAINYDNYMSSTDINNLSDETVAVIDTGFGSTDPVFDGRIVPGYDVADNDSDVYNPGSNHGTNVASMIALFSRSNVKIMPIKTSKDSNPESFAGSDIDNGIYYAIAQGANVINMSIGGYGNSWYSPATDAAYNANIICVDAAGNEAIDTISENPACYSNLITVGAYDSNTAGYPKWSSTNYGDLVDTYAPGYYLLAANNGGPDDWSWYAGTSLSSPIVAGGIADILGYQQARGAYLNAQNANVFMRLSNNGDHFDLYALNNMSMCSVLPYSGSGTTANPYIINTYAQLQNLSEMNYLGYDYRGVYFRLDSDITLGNDWVPIGYKSSGQAVTSNGGIYIGNGTVFPFEGNFDGNGHTITMTSTPISYPGSTYNIDYSGVFGYVMYGSISNLNVYINGNFTTPAATQYSGACFGGVVGRLEAGTISNCNVSGGTVTAGNSNTTVGRIVGIQTGLTIAVPPIETPIINPTPTPTPCDTIPIPTKPTFAATVSIQGWTYGEQPSTPTLTGNISGGAVTYEYASSQYGSFTTAVPTNAGTNWWCRAQIAETDAYAAVTTPAVNFTIAKASISPTVTMQSWFYGQTPDTPVISNNQSDGLITYSYYHDGSKDSSYSYFVSNTPPTDVDYYILIVDIGESQNYLEGFAQTTFQIYPAPPTAILTPKAESGNFIEIFPTLAKDKLYIKTNCNLSAYKIYNSQGKVCLAGVLQDNTVDVSTLYPGVYYIVSYNDNTAVNANKFIKH